MQRLTARVLEHKRLIALAWIALTVIGIAAAGPASKALDQKFSVPGREGWDANVAIVKQFGSGGESLPLVPVVTVPKGTSAAATRAGLARVERRLSAALPGSRVTGYGSTGDRAFLSRDRRTAYSLAFLRPSNSAFGDNAGAEKTARAALRGATIAGGPVHLTGFDALRAAAGGDNGGGTGVLLEALLGGAGALVVLIFVFGSALALVPLAMAISSVLTTFLLLWGLTTFTGVSPIVQFLVALIGLGVSIDYSLLVVVRWREEREKGLEGDEAVRAAMATAGRAVVFSGTTVAVGLLALVVLPLPFLRSVGYGGMLIPLVATLAAVTLLPVVLATIGPRLDKHRLRRRDRSNEVWRRWSEGVVRRRVAAIAAAVLVLGALVIAATGLNLGSSNPNTIAKAGDAKDGLVALQDSGIGNGAMAPVETLVRASDAAAVRDAQARVAGVTGAVVPTGPGWSRDGNVLVEAMSRDIDDTAAGRQAVADLRNAAHAAAPAALVGGAGPLDADFVDAVYGSFPLMIALIALVTFVLLARAFRSLVLPLKAVLLNVLSVGAAWGVIAIVWQAGNGSEQIWSIAATGSIAAWIPLMIFAFLYGLSMDYEVFILARMRERYDGGGATDEAVVDGLGRTGRLVTSAALILFLSFVAMASGPETDVKILATGLAAGILIDATVIRMLLVPAVVSLMGSWNWWLPSGPARLLRVRPSPEPAAESAG